MQLLFFQNCISPHQMPYIEALSQKAEIENIYVVVPRITYGHRAQQGWPETWTESGEKLHVLVSPAIEQVRALFQEVCSTALREQVSTSSKEQGRIIALFSGISAFPEVKQWFLASLEYRDLERGLITEAPFAQGKQWLLHLHRLHFLLTDYRYIHQVRYVFAIGEDCEDYYRRWSKRWRVIPFMYCTRSVGVLDSEGCKVGPLNILFAGSLEARKNVALLLEALKDVTFDYLLTIVGDGPLRADLENQAKQWNIKARFLGSMPNDQITDIMARHDLLVLPSLHDGWGAVINEAATVGTLTACSDQCGARRIANYTFGVNQPLQLRRILHSVSDDLYGLRSHRSDRIRWADQKISPQAVAEMMIEGLKND